MTSLCALMVGLTFQRRVSPYAVYNILKFLSNHVTSFNYRTLLNEITFLSIVQSVQMNSFLHYNTIWVGWTGWISIYIIRINLIAEWLWRTYLKIYSSWLYQLSDAALIASGNIGIRLMGIFSRWLFSAIIAFLR